MCEDEILLTYDEMIDLVMREVECSREEAERLLERFEKEYPEQLVTIQ